MFGTQTRYILAIRGVFLKDLKNPTPPAAMRTLPTDMSVSYTKIPSEYTTLEAWPARTSLRCWECDRNFTTPPVFIPVVDINKIIPKGVFCHWGCQAKYVALRYSPDEAWDINKLTLKILSSWKGKCITKIPPAPEKTRMAKYCGPGGLTDEEFEELCQQIAAEYASI